MSNINQLVQLFLEEDWKDVVSKRTGIPRSIEKESIPISNKITKKVKLPEEIKNQSLEKEDNKIESLKSQSATQDIKHEGERDLLFSHKPSDSPPISPDNIPGNDKSVFRNAINKYHSLSDGEKELLHVGGAAGATLGVGALAYHAVKKAFNKPKEENNN